MAVNVNEIQITDNSPLFGAEFEAAVLRALTECGMRAEGYGKDLCPVDTGNLRNSVTFQIDGDDCIVGTAVEYAPYVEMGTGKYVTGGSPPWSYQDDKGNWHHTSGQKAQPYIKPAIAEHEQEYFDVIKKHLKG